MNDQRIIGQCPKCKKAIPNCICKKVKKDQAPNTQEPKQCPFCGSKGRVDNCGKHFIPYCSNIEGEDDYNYDTPECPFKVESPKMYDTYEEAIAAWNHRPAEDALRDEVETQKALVYDFVQQLEHAGNRIKELEAAIDSADDTLALLEGMGIKRRNNSTLEEIEMDEFIKEWAKSFRAELTQARRPE